MQAPGPTRPADALLVCVAAAGTLLVAWVALSLTLSLLAALPGAAGAVAARGAATLAPAAVRRLAAALLGASLGATLSAGTAVATMTAAPAAASAAVSSIGWSRDRRPGRRCPVRGAGPSRRRGWCSRQHRGGHVRRHRTRHRRHGRHVRRHRRRPVRRHRRHGPGRRLDALSAGSHAGARPRCPPPAQPGARGRHPRRRGRGGPPRRHAVEHRRAVPGTRQPPRTRSRGSGRGGTRPTGTPSATTPT